MPTRTERCKEAEVFRSSLLTFDRNVLKKTLKAYKYQSPKLTIMEKIYMNGAWLFLICVLPLMHHCTTRFSGSQN